MLRDSRLLVASGVTAPAFAASPVVERLASSAMLLSGCEAAAAETSGRVSDPLLLGDMTLSKPTAFLAGDCSNALRIDGLGDREEFEVEDFALSPEDGVFRCREIRGDRCPSFVAGIELSSVITRICTVQWSGNRNVSHS